jgi:uncharacterized membrane protein YfcA
MMSFLSVELSTVAIGTVALVAILIGMSKTGVHGAGMMAVPLLATVFGGQLSSGVMLPMLCMADMLGVWYYHKHASWSHLKKLMPWALAGTILATIFAEHIPDDAYKMLMGSIILASMVLLVWMERNDKNKSPDTLWFASGMGVVAGFTSMVGNLAGSITAVYFLSMRLPKNVFIGTTAWFFLVINLMKIPFHVFAWNTISVSSLMLNLAALPAIVVGAILGIYITKKLPELLYRWFIIIMTSIAAILLFF